MRLRLVAFIAASLGLLAASLFAYYTCDQTKRFEVQGDAMAPTLEDGQRVTMLSGKTPQRFDIVVFKAKGPDGDRTISIIERVVGLPGENIEVRDGAVWVNGDRLQEPHASQANYADGPVTLGAEEYYVLGDNRAESYDSHSFGPVHEDDIRGVVRD